MNMSDEQALRDLALAHLVSLVESSDDAIFSQTLDSVVTSWNSAAERLYGYTAAEVIGRSIDRFMPPDRMREEQVILERIRAGERVKHFETVRLRRDGAEIYVSLTISPILNAVGEIIGASKIARDMSAERAERERMMRLSAKAQQLAAVVESSDDAIISTTMNGLVTSWNRGAVDLFGYMAEEMLGRSILTLMSSADCTAVEDPGVGVCGGSARGAISAVGRFESRLACKDGRLVEVSVTKSPIYSEDGRIVGISMIARDIGERLEHERRIAHEASHDSLTGLPNRRLLMETLTKMVCGTQESQACFAVIYIDLDGFKEVNDSCGHEAGDGVLVDIAHRLRRTLRPADFVARLGGDEFVVLASRIRSEVEAEELGARLAAALRVQVGVSARAPRDVSASFGVSLHPAHGVSVNELLQRADRALYTAKHAGRNQVVIYRE